MNFPYKKFFSFVVLSALGIWLIAYVYRIFLAPLLFSLLLTFIFAPFVNSLEARKIPRGLSAFIITALLTTLFIVATVTLVPILYKQIVVFLNLALQNLQVWKNDFITFFKAVVIEKGLISGREFDGFVSRINPFSQLRDNLEENLWGIASLAPKWIGGVLTEILVPVLTFFFLKNLKFFQVFFIKAIPGELLTPLSILMGRIERVTRAVLHGQFIVAFILGCLYSVGFSLIGLNSAIFIGVIAGICRVIPYLDIAASFLLSFIVISANFTGWTQVIGLCVVVLVVQALDGIIITPKIIGGRTGIHPLIVVVSVIAFGNVFGFIGVLLALPVIATIKVAMSYFIPIYLNTDFYKKGLNQ